MAWNLLPVIVTTMLPVAELRGGIPLGILQGLPPALVIPLAIVVNCLIFFPIYFCLELLYERFFIRYAWARRLIERVHRRGRPYLERYGILGLIILVGIPLPVTGVYTGTGIAWLLGLDWKRSFLAVCVGVVIAACIVSLVTFGLIGGAGLLAKI